MVKPLIVLVVVIIAVAAFFGWDYYRRGVVGPVVKLQQVVQKPFDKYTYESLIKTEFSPSEVTIGSLVSDNPEFVSRMFYFYVGGPSTRSGTSGQANPGQAKKVSGLVNFPKKDGTYPVIVMYRGYIDRETYKTGDGTRRSGEMFAQNGFITVAPDFLGYGQSDMPAGNPMEERFQVYTAAITLLRSIPNLNKAFTSAGTGVRADAAKVGIWGHSNGGQVALTVLEATGTNVPTVLWAPVSKPFPYSILYYTDDIDDHGKALRKVVADFEKDYDSELYSLTNYLDKINAPIQIHQGGGDEAVPIKWSDDLVKVLKDKGKDVSYFTYAGDDHNFAKGSWQTVVNRNIEFYKQSFSLNEEKLE